MFLGPWYALLCAALIGIIRMLTMGIPPLALTGAIFGAFLSGVCYRLSKGKIICAVIGEIIGTGVIGAIISYPVMTFLWGKEGLSWLFYVPSFLCGTLIGGSIAYVFLRKFASNGMLEKLQDKLGSPCYTDKTTTLSDAVSIAGIGAILFVVTELACDLFCLQGRFWDALPFAALGVCTAAAVIFYFTRKGKATHV